MITSSGTLEECVGKLLRVSDEEYMRTVDGCENRLRGLCLCSTKCECCEHYHMVSGMLEEWQQLSDCGKHNFYKWNETKSVLLLHITRLLY